MSRPLELVPGDGALDGVRDGSLRMAFVRLPVDRTGLHQIVLYAEQPVVVVPLEHPVTAYDEIPLADLAGEHLHDLDQVSVRDAVEAVAAGTGVVVVPLSVARLHHRKDVTTRPVTGVDESEVALVWRVDDDDSDLDTFVGIVRGRSAQSSRGAAAATPAPKKKPPAKPVAKKPAKRPAKRSPRGKSGSR